jgi:hypothetical protein
MLFREWSAADFMKQQGSICIYLNEYYKRGGCPMKSKFRNYAILLFLLTSVGVMSCGDVNIDSGGVTSPTFPTFSFRNTDFEATAPFSFEVEVGNRSLLRLQGINDHITITGISGATSVMITGIRRVGSDSIQDAEEHLGELQVNVQRLANEVVVETTQPQNTGDRNYIVDYTITLPKNLEVRVTNINGIVTLDAIENDVSVNNVNGEATLIGIVGSARVVLVNGTIESAVTLPLDGTIDMRTTNGAIALDIPQSTSAECSANVGNGNISVANLVLQNEVRTPTSLSGTLGNGQGTMFLMTVNGNIRVSGF